MKRLFLDSSVLFSAAYSPRGEARHLILMAIPEGEVLFEPPDDACFSDPTWSPGGHLIAGHSGADIVIWDLNRGESVIVAPELEGRKIFLGWDPDPQVGE